MRGDTLFSRDSLGETLTGLIVSMQEEVKNYPAADFLSTPIEQVNAYLIEKFRAEPVVLHEDLIESEMQEGLLNTQGPNHLINRPGPVSIETTWAIINIPYTGKKRLFQLTPNEYDHSRPSAEITETHVRLHIPMLRREAGEIKQALESDIAKIRLYLDRQAKQMAAFNDRLSQAVHEATESRRQKLLREQQVMQALGVPIKHRADATPIPVQRKISVRPPKPTRGSSNPYLDSAVYEEILDVLQRMNQVLERSPSAFVGIDEEDLRWHFVIQLNGSFTTGATGETFNAHGKSDIFLPCEGGNVFIAECKFWKGAAEFTKVFNQLFSYTTWRDTKVAILLFNRNEDFSAVVAKATEVAKSHKCFKRTSSYGATNGFRAIYGHPDDAEREVTVTCLCFDVPR